MVLAESVNVNVNALYGKSYKMTSVMIWRYINKLTLFLLAVRFTHCGVAAGLGCSIKVQKIE